MTPRLDILNRMPGVRIQPVSAGGGGGPVVARKSAPPTFQEDFYTEREDSDNFQINNYVGGAEFNELRRVRKAHSEKIFATVEQKKILMEHYHVNNYPTTEDMARMTELTGGLDERFLKQWFQYTRKHMKSKGKVPVRIEPPPPDHVGYVVPGALRPEKDFVSFQYDPSDAVETKIERNSFTHEEAIEKAMQYDDLKRKFDELHKNFMVMSNALLKKGYKGDADYDSTQRSTPINQEVTATGKEEFQDNNGDKTLNGPFRPPADSTSTPVVARVKHEKEVGESAKKEPVYSDDKDDPSKNINLPPFPQETNSNQSYAPPYHHPGPYPPHPMYPPYQPPYNPNLPPHMQPPPPNWPPYQQPPAWNPNYPPYGAAGYPPSSYPPPSQAPAGYPPTQPYGTPHSGTNYQQPPPPSTFPGQTPPPSNPFHSTPPPPHVAGQTPPPPHPPYPPHPYHMQSAQYPTPPDPTHPYNTYNPPHEPSENLQMKIEEPQVKTESVSPQPPPTVEMDI